MPGTSLFYRGATRFGAALLPIAGLFDRKVRRGILGRLESHRRFVDWGHRARDPSRPLIWFHAPSVGEGLQAESVLGRLRRRHPDWQFAYTYFSPSAEELAPRLGVEPSGYLPLDTVAGTGEILDALRPSALVFTKLDLWPELSTRAAGRGIPVALIAGTVRPGSARLRWPARALLAPGYRCLSAVAAVAEADANRLRVLGVPADRLSVQGDPRFDNAMDRVSSVRTDDPLLRMGKGAPTLVAGSTWSGDEAVLLDAFARLHVHRPDARLILVPHEPTENHLLDIERAVARRGLPRAVRLSSTAEPVPLLLVDRVGVLSTLYGAGGMAYVGRGFHAAGLHSVLEPAAWGIPVAFGPRWTESRDAGLLLEAGGAEVISEFGTSEAGEVLRELWEDWIGNETRRAAQGRKARRLVEAGMGAAERCVELVEKLVSSKR